MKIYDMKTYIWIHYLNRITQFFHLLCPGGSYNISVRPTTSLAYLPHSPTLYQLLFSLSLVVVTNSQSASWNITAE